MRMQSSCEKCDLDDAEFGIEGPLPNHFGVDAGNMPVSLRSDTRASRSPRLSIMRP